MTRRLAHILSLLALALVFATGASSAGTPPGKQPPQNTGLPTISGAAQVGGTLTAGTGSWDGVSLTYTFQWLRCDSAGGACASAAGQTSATYVATSVDAGRTLRLVVTATNKNGAAAATSAPTTISALVIVPTPTPTAPASTAAPILSGTPVDGQSLSTTNGTWSGTPTGYSYQWKRCDTTGAACGSIAGATAQSYALTSSDLGATIRSMVTASSTAGSGTATSAASVVVTASAPAPVPAPTQNSRFGFAAGGNLQNFSATDLARYLDGAKAAHAGWIRIDINWSVIQYAGATSYNWAPFDNVVNAVTARGMKPLAGILYTPPWARPAGTGGNYPPTNLADYANFVKTAVARYAPMGVHAYEVWNEPNIVNFWAPGPDPVRYTQLLKLAYSAIKSADPTATVISAGLSPYGSYGQSDAQHMNPLNFLEGMYAAGAAGSFDAVGWHPYNYPYGLSFAGWSAWSQMSQTTPSARSIMTGRGDGAKQIWATEWGYPTGSTTRDVSEATQAQLITDSYAALKGWSWAGPAFIYSYHDNGTNKLDIEQNFGIIHFDWSPKLSYVAYQSAAAAG